MAQQSAKHTGAAGLFNPSVSVPAGADGINAAIVAVPAQATGCGSTIASPLSAVLPDMCPEWPTGEQQLDACCS